MKFIDDQSEANRAAYIAADSAFNEARKNAVNYVKTSTSNPSFNDVNYVFPNFVITYMPMGVIGLIIAAIFAAAMSSVSAELNALATATTIDFYRRHVNPDGSDRQMVRFGRVATFFWGIFACIVAMYATNLGSLIEVVNTFGSFFYGSLLGVFVLAIGVKRARSRGAFLGLLIGMATVLFTSFVHVSGGNYYLAIPFLSTDLSWSKFLVDIPGLATMGSDPQGKPAIEFLWLNLVGCVATTVAGYLISLTVRDTDR
jgi:Na+/proline symporter